MLLGRKEGWRGWRGAIKCGRRLRSQTRTCVPGQHRTPSQGSELWRQGEPSGGQLGSAMGSPFPQHRLLLQRARDGVEEHAWT